MPPFCRHLFFALVVSSASLGCERAPAAAQAASPAGSTPAVAGLAAATSPTVDDALPPALPAKARLVTLGSAVSEIVAALGATDQIVAVDTSSMYPLSLLLKTKVGYQRQVQAEGVLAQQPDAVLLTQEAGPPAALQQLESAGVRLVRLPAEPTVHAAQQRIRQVGALLGRQKEAEALLATMNAQLDAAKANRPGNAQRVLFIYARGQGTVQVAGRNTAADLMLTLAGLTNAAEALDGFKPLTAEAVAASRADVLVFTTHGLSSVGGKDGAIRLPGVAQSTAGAAGRITAVDDLLLLGLGPRLGEGVAELQKAVASAGGTL